MVCSPQSESCLSERLDAPTTSQGREMTPPGAPLAERCTFCLNNHPTASWGEVPHGERHIHEPASPQSLAPQVRVLR